LSCGAGDTQLGPWRQSRQSVLAWTSVIELHR
jgi:hypothetical protein